MAAISLALGSWQGMAQAQDKTPATPTMGEVHVHATRINDEAPYADKAGDLPAQRARSSDTSSLLQDLPGFGISGAGGVSGLPVIRGFADDRNRIKVDDMDLISACANHMNPALSYIDPTQVESLKVYSSLVPVSVGGDASGGAILVKSRAPRFAEKGQGLLTSGEVGGFYRSNGNALGANLSATLAGEQLSVSYSASSAESENYRAAKSFKSPTVATRTTEGSHLINGDVVGSSAYKTQNQSLGLAWRQDNHLLELKLGYQHIPYQGFPNQHMDMTDNTSHQMNLAYTGQYLWGKLEARLYREKTRHKMDFGPDKLYWYGGAGTVPGMPMDTEGINTGAVVKAEIQASNRDTYRVGAEIQRYRLNDWWSPSGGGMAPDTFWNIKDGQRNRLDVFGELESRWSEQWLSLFGVRSSQVTMTAGNAQGYNSGYSTDANAFNAKDHQRTDHNLDLTALARFSPDATQTYEGGYSRKTRSPSLYERYTWSTGGMAMTMNNWVNDGNGYVGDINLKPEVAHTVSLSGDWHDASREVWGFRFSPYASYVDNYIDATCNTTCTASRYNYLRLVNDNARLLGADASGFFPVGNLGELGKLSGRVVINYVDGKNRSSGDNLYNIMPLNGKLALDRKAGGWTNTLEAQAVAAKSATSQVRNEMRTAGYGLLNLRNSYETKGYRIDFGVENALNRQYAHPLGGAYIGQGTTMSLNGAGAPYGYTVPGMGRSFYLGLNLRY